MELTAHEIDLIRDSFRCVARDSERAADLFYGDLFERAPRTRELFVADMTKQGVKLMSTLGIVVALLQNWSELAPIIDDLALRHVVYGVRAEHYELVGAALMAMLAQMLDEDFTAETQAAWRKAYDGLAEFMIAAAERETTLWSHDDLASSI